MAASLEDSIKKYLGLNYALHEAHINPVFSKVLKTIGFDRCYQRGTGPYLYDRENREYLDFLSGYGVYGLGRNHPRIKKAVREFLEMDTPNLVQMEAPLLSGILASRLVELTEDKKIAKVFFTNSGTEAIETAIKFARAATGKQRILFFDHAFHGLSTGSLSLNGSPQFREGFGELLPGATQIPFDDLSALEAELRKGDVAAFFFEPIQGKRVLIPHDLFLPEAEKLCRKYGALMVADEVQTGLGRTGKWFAHHHAQVKPDIICVAKTLSGGMAPVGAVLSTDQIYQKTFSRMDRCVVHSSTFGQNDLAMVCGITTLDILKEEKLIERAEAMGALLMDGLVTLAKKHEWIKSVRGRGLMIGIELGKPKSLAKRLKWAAAHKIENGLFAETIVMQLLAKHRILTQVAGHHVDIIKILPPYVISEEDCRRFHSALDDVLGSADKLAGPIWTMGKNLLKYRSESA